MKSRIIMSPKGSCPKRCTLLSSGWIFTPTMWIWSSKRLVICFISIEQMKRKELCPNWPIIVLMPHLFGLSCYLSTVIWKMAMRCCLLCWITTIFGKIFVSMPWIYIPITIVSMNWWSSWRKRERCYPIAGSCFEKWLLSAKSVRSMSDLSLFIINW